MKLTRNHVYEKLLGYITLQVVLGIPPGISLDVGLGLHCQGILLLFWIGFSLHALYQGIHLGIPDICHWRDGWTEWAMHRWVQLQM